jgi:hypothetical protein
MLPITPMTYHGEPCSTLMDRLPTRSFLAREAKAIATSMSHFCPDGYLPISEALMVAARFWFPDKIAAFAITTEPESETKPEQGLDAMARGLSQPEVPHAKWQAFKEIANETVHSLRNLLHQGKLTAYYFREDGCHPVSREFWATADADGVIESGTYWPWGKPTPLLYDQGPHYPLVVNQLQLDALFKEEAAGKSPLPRARIPDLIAALRGLEHLPNRKSQREALRKMPEFQRYRLTDKVLRAAEKQVPRESGRKAAPS